MLKRSLFPIKSIDAKSILQKSLPLNNKTPINISSTPADNFQLQLINIKTRPVAADSDSDIKTMVQHKDSRLIWVDLEMTGLDVDNDHILEIACMVTDKDLSLIAEGPNLVIHQSDAILDGMNEWCVEHHGQSGLTEASKNSKIELKGAEKMVLDFVQKHTPRGKCPLAGNSVGTDKVFLTKYMPQFAEHLHYRIIDVSSVKELCRRWYPVEFKVAPAKKIAHREEEKDSVREIDYNAHDVYIVTRAMDDIKESIEELKYYRSAIFK